MAMEQHAVVPDAITYIALFSTYEKGKQPERALQVFEAIEQHSVVSTAISYSAVISA